MIRLAVLLIALAGPACATTDGWPALYNVSGVASGDVLNVRAGPGVGHDIIGSLAPNAANVEVIRPSDDFEWGLVNVGERSGWASLTFLARHGGHWDGKIPDPRQCFGTEPFWSITIDPPRMTLAMPGMEARKGLISGLYGSRSRRDRFAFRGSFFPTEAGDLDAVFAIRTEACDDGMSDRDYGIGVDLLLTSPSLPLDRDATGLFSGCCSIAPPAE